MLQCVRSFLPRTEFLPHNVPLANFASHHRQALADLRNLSRQVDYVLELRDSRAPLSSVNPLIHQTLPGIPKLTLYSKWDTSKVKKTQLDPLHPDGAFRLFTVEKRKYAGKLLRDLKEHFKQQSIAPPLGYKILIAGMPNAGKSTLINNFRTLLLGKRAKKVARTGSNPGVTRAVSEQILISSDPKIYVLDTPGVLMPQVRDWEHMLKLCLIGAVPRSRVDPIILADYLLFHLNKCYPKGGRYPGRLSNDIYEVLWNLAQTNRRKPNKETWDSNHTASEWVDRFLMGGVGKLCLDDLTSESIEMFLHSIQANEYDLKSLLPAQQLTSKTRRLI